MPVRKRLCEILRFSNYLILDVKARVDFDAEGVSAHAVASLLKLFVRQLPEPLLPFKYYTTLLKVNSKLFHMKHNCSWK
jgi:hypothetical protein